ncbi:Exodeoxyribonuclease V [Patulibacter medicamentivorans]|uniref:Exodeoxyribonuclease V n=1 Tax=Patulibacter medicamentivorans TaxID=1097667 RepID=H0E4V1_9ACTN|nr:Exodeoxyribonuclease V [Patulibacter medicamentivorans]
MQRVTGDRGVTKRAGRRAELELGTDPLDARGGIGGGRGELLRATLVDPAIVDRRRRGDVDGRLVGVVQRQVDRADTAERAGPGRNVRAGVDAGSGRVGVADGEQPRLDRGARPGRGQRRGRQRIGRSGAGLAVGRPEVLPRIRPRTAIDPDPEVLVIVLVAVPERREHAAGDRRRARDLPAQDRGRTTKLTRRVAVVVDPATGWRDDEAAALRGAAQGRLVPRTRATGSGLLVDRPVLVTGGGLALPVVARGPRTRLSRSGAEPREDQCQERSRGEATRHGRACHRRSASALDRHGRFAARGLGCLVLDRQADHDRTTRAQEPRDLRALELDPNGGAATTPHDGARGSESLAVAGDVHGRGASHRGLGTARHGHPEHPVLPHSDLAGRHPEPRRRLTLHPQARQPTARGDDVAIQRDGVLSGGGHGVGAGAAEGLAAAETGVLDDLRQHDGVVAGRAIQRHGQVRRCGQSVGLDGPDHRLHIRTHVVTLAGLTIIRGGADRDGHRAGAGRVGDGVAAFRPGQDIRATGTMEQIITVAAVQEIRTGTTSQAIVPGAAVQLDRRIPSAQRVVGRGPDHDLDIPTDVVALTGRPVIGQTVQRHAHALEGVVVGDRVPTTTIHDLVAARPAGELVVPFATVQAVGATVTVQHVAPRTASQGAGLLVTLELIIALATIQEIAARGRLQQIAARPTHDLIGPAATVEIIGITATIESVAAFIASDAILARTARQDIVAIRARQLVIAVRAIQRVVPRTTVSLIITRTGRDDVGTEISVDRVITGSGVDLVLTGARQQLVIPVAPDKLVVASTSVKRVVPRATIQQVIRRAGGDLVVARPGMDLDRQADIPDTSCKG